MRELGLDFTNPLGIGGSVGSVSVFGLQWCKWGMDRGLDQTLEGWCYVCVSCESGLFV